MKKKKVNFSLNNENDGGTIAIGEEQFEQEKDKNNIVGG